MNRCFKGKTNTVWSICTDQRFNFSCLPHIFLHRKHFVAQPCGHRAASSIWPLVRCILYHFIIFSLWYTNSQFKFLNDVLLFNASKEEKLIIVVFFTVATVSYLSASSAATGQSLLPLEVFCCFCCFTCKDFL